jgi:thioredoxin reductase (NADPH)
MIYDVIILGAGPAGIEAAVYASRYKLKTLVIGEVFGGLVNEAYEICNFLTCYKVKGPEMSKRMVEHVKQSGVDIIGDKVVDIKKGKDFEIKTLAKKTFHGKKLIIAVGKEKRRLGLKNEKEFQGKGISYCATCDATLYPKKTVGVVGGGDSALHAALLVADYAKKVYIIHRGKEYNRADPMLVDVINKNKKIQKVFDSEVNELIVNDALQGVVLKSGKKLKLDGLFIEIGSDPRSQLAQKIGVKLNKWNEIMVDKSQRTNVSGVFAAGDISDNPLKQIITAAAEGAIAATTAYNELKKE